MDNVPEEEGNPAVKIANAHEFIMATGARYQTASATAAISSPAGRSNGSPLQGQC